MRKDIPVSARLPMMRAVVVKCIVEIDPFFQKSCSLFTLWLIDPEHMNNIALKKS